MRADGNNTSVLVPVLTSTQKNEMTSHLAVEQPIDFVPLSAAASLRHTSRLDENEEQECLDMLATASMSDVEVSKSLSLLDSMLIEWSDSN